MWIGDFVRCHTVVTLAKERWPRRPLDILSSSQCAPLADYMPGVRQAIVFDVPRRRLAFGIHRQLAEKLRQQNYGTALIMSRKWKAALAPFLAGVPERVGFVGEARLGLINDLRRGEWTLPRMVDRCAVLALPKGAAPPPAWPAPELVVPPAEIGGWRARNGLAGNGRPTVALCPGAVGPGKRWPEQSYAALARLLAGAGVETWILGSPNETPLAGVIAAGNALARDLTGPDLQQAILALAAADAVVSNDSGLLHVSAAIGTPTVGLFGPTSVWHWAPLNPIAASLEAPWRRPCPVCAKPDCSDVRHRQTGDIPAEDVFATTERVLAAVGTAHGVPATRSIARATSSTGG
jgi:heptosyltransferase-2